MQYLLIVLTLSGAFEIDRVYDTHAECFAQLKTQLLSEERTGWMCKEFKYEPVLD